MAHNCNHNSNLACKRSPHFKAERGCRGDSCINYRRFAQPTAAPKTLTPHGHSKAADILNQCGGKIYGACAQVHDMMLRDAMDVRSLQRHITRQIGSNLAHSIAENMPENMVVQRKGDDDPRFFMRPGITEYRTEVVVLTRENFDKFVETLLNQFGDEYAAAALATKKNNLKKNLAAAVDKA